MDKIIDKIKVLSIKYNFGINPKIGFYWILIIASYYFLKLYGPMKFSLLADIVTVFFSVSPFIIMHKSPLLPNDVLKTITFFAAEGRNGCSFEYAQSKIDYISIIRLTGIIEYLSELKILLVSNRIEHGNSIIIYKLWTFKERSEKIII